MDDATKTLELFSLELPDKEQELSLQKTSPDIFTCFPKLPLEVRTMIWTQILPGRRFMGLDSLLGITDAGLCSQGSGPPVDCKRDPKAPTALHINQESRGIALAHYTSMYNTWWFVSYAGDRRWVRRYVFLDPKVDLVYMNAIGIIQRPRIYERAFQHFARNTECFRKIESLEVRDFNWYLDKHWYNQLDLWQDLGGVLNLFHGLKELHVVDFRRASDHKKFSLGGNALYVEEMFELLGGWFVENAGYQPPEALRSIPEIIPHDYRRIEARSDEENREVARIPCSLDEDAT